MVYGELDGSPFATEYINRKYELRLLATRQRIPGMRYKDVFQEMSLTLWRACATYDPAQGTTLGQYWWACWLRRKRDLIESWFAQKNPNPDYMDVWDIDELYELAGAFSPMFELEDLCPSTGATERTVWRMIADGFSGVEIKRILHLSRRRYDAIVARWQTDDLRRLLLGATT